MTYVFLLAPFSVSLSLLDSEVQSGSTHSLEISLIVSTRNRSGSLARCLEAVGRIDRDPDSWELVVVDNGSTDRTSDVIRGFADCALFRVVEVKEPRPGLTRARNRGVAASAGEILAFTDDDCYPAPDFLNQICTALRSNGWGYLGGRILLHDPSDARIGLNEKVETQEFPACSVVDVGLIQGANMAVRRQVLERIGGFDERLGPGHPFNCEDVDMVTRASFSGERGGYCPGPTVYHHHGRKSGREEMQTRRSYEYGIGAYHAKFLMDRRSRSACFKLWRDNVKNCIRLRRLGTLARETTAMLHYGVDTVMRRIGLNFDNSF